jgi:hypothetical protein
LDSPLSDPFFGYGGLGLNIRYGDLFVYQINKNERRRRIIAIKAA